MAARFRMTLACSQREVCPASAACIALPRLRRIRNPASPWSWGWRGLEGILVDIVVVLTAATVLAEIAGTGLFDLPAVVAAYLLGGPGCGSPPTAPDVA